MFNDLSGMYEYLNTLKLTVEKFINEKKEGLNYKCEVCKINSIEVDYKPGNFTEELYDEENNKNKLIINCNFFCRGCYKKLLDTGQIEKSVWMEQIDSEIFEEA